jgi:hypothetical protein
MATVQSPLPQTAARLLEDSPWFFLEPILFFIDLLLLSLAEPLSSSLAFRRLGFVLSTQRRITSAAALELASGTSN